MRSLDEEQYRRRTRLVSGVGGLHPKYVFTTLSDATADRKQVNLKNAYRTYYSKPDVDQVL